MAGQAIRDARLVIDHRTIPYAIRVSSRARHPSLSISPATGLVLVVPERPLEPIEPFLHRSREWIVRQVDRFDARSRCRPRRWPYGSTLLVRGDEHRVEVIIGAPAVTQHDHVLTVALRRPSLEGARRWLKRWYLEEATRAIPPRVDALGRERGITWRRLRIRDMRRRWGSCSPRGDLTLNVRLIMAPAPVMDYVILHELMHRRVLNHSKQFWALVAQACPAYRDAVAWLKTQGDFLTL